MDASRNKLAADKHGFSDRQEILRLRADRDVLLEALKGLVAAQVSSRRYAQIEALNRAIEAIATAEGGR